MKRDPGLLPEEVLFLKENKRELHEALEKLRTSYKEVIILRYIKGFSVQETCEILNWSESKVKTTLHREMFALEKNYDRRDRSVKGLHDFPDLKEDLKTLDEDSVWDNRYRSKLKNRILSDIDSRSEKFKFMKFLVPTMKITGFLAVCFFIVSLVIQDNNLFLGEPNRGNYSGIADHEKMEQELSEIMGKTVHVPIHDNLSIGTRLGST